MATTLTERIKTEALVQPSVRPSVFLTPERVVKMLHDRRDFQVVKFRTNCSDCVPNL